MNTPYRVISLGSFETLAVHGNRRMPVRQDEIISLLTRAFGHNRIRAFTLPIRQNPNKIFIECFNRDQCVDLLSQVSFSANGYDLVVKGTNYTYQQTLMRSLSLLADAYLQERDISTEIERLRQDSDTKDGEIEQLREDSDAKDGQIERLRQDSDTKDGEIE